MATTTSDSGTQPNREDAKQVRIVGLGDHTTPLIRYTVSFGEELIDAENLNPEDEILDDGQTARGGVTNAEDHYWGTGAVEVTHEGEGDESAPIEVYINGEKTTEVGVGGSWTSDGGFLSLVPGLLPGIGPLNSSQTTAAAILVALAIAGAVLR